MFDSPLKDGLIVLVIVLLFFGPKRLPQLSRAIGESVREFRGGISHLSDSDSEEKSTLSSAPVAAPAPVPAPAPVAAPAPVPAPAEAPAQPSSTSSEQHTNA